MPIPQTVRTLISDLKDHLWLFFGLSLLAVDFCSLLAFALIPVILLSYTLSDGPRRISKVLIGTANFVSGDTPLLSRRLCTAAQFIVCPLWLITCASVGVALSTIICSGGFVILFLYEIITRVVRMLLCGDPAMAIYSGYYFQRSDSQLLRLPPEVRRQIWQELLNDFKTITLETDEHGTSKLVCCYRTIPPEPKDITETCPHKAINLTYLRTCRQIYAEVDQLIFSSKTFYHRRLRQSVAVYRQSHSGSETKSCSIRVEHG